MNPAAGCLDYEAGPHLRVPAGFFLVATLFGVLAGLLLVLVPESLSTRWHPGAFALTHLIAVGFMLTVMMGALYQILPVVAGAAVAGGTVGAFVVLMGWGSGAAALSWGLFTMSTAWLEAAANILTASFALFVLASMLGLWRRAVGMTIHRDLRLALGGLAVAVMLGATLALTLAGHIALPVPVLLDIHMAWALLGGAGLLLGATSWIVVPMFQVTPAYPDWLSRMWGPLVLAVLGLWSAARLFMPEGATEIVLRGALLILALAFVLATLFVKHRARKSRADATGRGFAWAMACFAAAIILGALMPWSADARVAMLCGVLALYGGFVGVIQAMLYKIVPFLTWLHLTQIGLRAPNMRKLLPEPMPRWHQHLHLGALLLLLIASLMSSTGALGRLAGVAVMADFALLAVVQLRVLRCYQQERATGTPKELVRAPDNAPGAGSN